MLEFLFYALFSIPAIGLAMHLGSQLLEARADRRADAARLADAEAAWSAPVPAADRPVFGAAAILRAAYASGDPRAYLAARHDDPAECARYATWRAGTRLAKRPQPAAENLLGVR